MCRRIKKPEVLSFDSQADLCLYNLKLFVRYKYSSLDEFYIDLDRRIALSGNNYNRDDIRERISYVKNIWKGTRRVGDIWQENLEAYLGLQAGALMSPYMPRSTSYVQVHCRGSDAKILYGAIVSNPAEWNVVEECAVISGSAGLFIKLHGTELETANLLTNQLYTVDGTNIHHSVTNLSFQEYMWERYNIDEFARQSSPPYWYREEDGPEE